MSPENVVHPRTKTNAIIKSTFVNSTNGIDEICVCAYSYDIIPQIDFIPVYGGDGKWHSVPVPWDDYIPLEVTNNFFVAPAEIAKNKTIMAQRNNLCIFN